MFDIFERHEAEIIKHQRGIASKLQAELKRYDVCVHIGTVSSYMQQWSMCNDMLQDRADKVAAFVKDARRC
jgi:hypothetical protein